MPETINQNLEGHPIPEHEFQRFNIDKNGVYTHMKSLEDLRKQGPNMIIAECKKNCEFMQNQFKTQKLIKKIALQGGIFFVISLAYELVALQLSQWQFNGTQYIGWIELLGHGFPFEELLWLIFAVPAFICVYEYFVDDRK